MCLLLYYTMLRSGGQRIILCRNEFNQSLRSDMASLFISVEAIATIQAEHISMFFATLSPLKSLSITKKYLIALSFPQRSHVYAVNRLCCSFIWIIDMFLNQHMMLVILCQNTHLYKRNRYIHATIFFRI